MKFKLIMQEENGDKVTHEFESYGVADIMESFKKFLNGCGFQIESIDFEIRKAG